MRTRTHARTHAHTHPRVSVTLQTSVRSASHRLARNEPSPTASELRLLVIATHVPPYHPTPRLFFFPHVVTHYRDVSGGWGRIALNQFAPHPALFLQGFIHKIRPESKRGILSRSKRDDHHGTSALASLNCSSLSTFELSSHLSRIAIN